jgi:hypothetical protein
VISVLRRSVEWYLFTDVSGQRIVSILKGKEIQEENHFDFFALEDATDKLYRNVGKQLPPDAE